jgi:hypothetical protein
LIKNEREAMTTTPDWKKVHGTAAAFGRLPDFPKWRFLGRAILPAFEDASKEYWVSSSVDYFYHKGLLTRLNGQVFEIEIVVIPDYDRDRLVVRRYTQGQYLYRSTGQIHDEPVLDREPPQRLAGFEGQLRPAFDLLVSDAQLLQNPRLLADRMPGKLSFYG